MVRTPENPPFLPVLAPAAEDGLQRKAGLSRREALTRAGLGLGAAATLAACQTADHAGAETGRVLAFEHGVASGDPLSDRVILWTRVTPQSASDLAPVNVRWRVARDPEMRRVVAKGEVMTSAARDFTVKVDATGLAPATEYFYRFSVAGAESMVGRTRTLPVSGAQKVVFAVCSCSNYPAGYFNAYRAVARIKGLDLVLHTGDYIYEYGAEGYGGETGVKLGRVVAPRTEILTLADYRIRHAQYKSDTDLQAAHAAAPWIIIWDDHETANDSWSGGAQNHNPERGEGEWSARRKDAVQAWYEWLPVRDPDAGRPAEAIYRSFDFGGLARFIMLETRLTGRSKQLDWNSGIAEAASLIRGAPVAPAEIQNAPEFLPAVQKFVAEKLNDPGRAMMGPEQEAFVAAQMKDSTANGGVWQVIGNQVVMARTNVPDFSAALSEENKAKLSTGSAFIRRLITFSKLGLPWNLDAWDGYPAARDRLYAAAQAAKGNMVVVTGDTHTAWANELWTGDGTSRIGLEFAGTSVSSPGLGDTVTPDMADVGKLWAEKNKEVVWHDAVHKGFLLVTLTKQEALAEYHVVDTVLSTEFTSRVVKSFRAKPGENGSGPGPLEEA